MAWAIGILRFLWKNKKATLFGFASLVLLAWGYGFIKGLNDIKEDKQILECNQTQLEDQLAVITRLLEDEKLDRERVAQELVEMRLESQERQETIRDLQSILRDQTIEDDLISARTRQFYRELNNRAKEIE